MVDLGNRDHRTLMALLATQSQRAVLRARRRVLTAMHNRATPKAATSAGDRPTGTASSALSAKSAHPALVTQFLPVT
jgi:hypothetical protein